MPAVVQGLKGLQKPLKGFGLRDLGRDEKTLALADSVLCETGVVYLCPQALTITLAISTDNSSTYNDSE